jgi:P27 family predicted phage terminase small subunit
MVATVPTKLKLLRGNPSRVPIGPEPEPRISADVPSPPEHMSPDAVVEWHKIAPELHRIGLLTEADVTAFAGWCEVAARWIKAERDLRGQPYTVSTDEGGTKINPLVSVANMALRDMMHGAAQFGMTPAGRARLNAGITRPPKKFSGLVS